jgi:hypothetical protein
MERHVRRLNMIFMLQCMAKGFWYSSYVLVICVCFQDRFVDLVINSKFQGAPKKFKDGLTINYAGGHFLKSYCSFRAI